MIPRFRERFKNANEAYNYFYKHIPLLGEDFADTRALFNIGFYLRNPMDNEIHAENRKWNKEYAEAEWKWYLTGDQSVSKLGDIYGKVPPIWERMADADGNVNSNYGYQWQRNNQLDRVVDMLKENPATRQAAISIYDAKEMDLYPTDTPCTYAVQFTITKDPFRRVAQDGILNMSVVMRSNDLWYGFCNDQYCFSKLQELVADRVGIPIGEYYHFAHNLHLYNNKLPE